MTNFWDELVGDRVIESADSDAYFNDSFKVTSLPIGNGHQE